MFVISSVDLELCVTYNGIDADRKFNHELFVVIVKVRKILSIYDLCI